MKREVLISAKNRKEALLANFKISFYFSDSCKLYEIINESSSFAILYSYMYSRNLIENGGTAELSTCVE